MKKILKRAGLIFLSLLGVLLATMIVFLICMESATHDLVKLDDKGRLYSVEYTGNYESELLKFVINCIKPVKEAGCTVMAVENPEGDKITLRNYDLAHPDKEGNPTGLNVCVYCNPQNGYGSLAMADMAWASFAGLPYYEGAFDEGILKKSLLALAPYMCMDGMNTEGLCVSILALDIKEGEHATYQTDAAKEEVILTVLMRRMLDYCKDTEEAVELAKSVNVVNTLGYDFHLMVNDAKGNAVVLEWRNDILTVTASDLVTNFYLAYDDFYGHGQDRYEAAGKVLDENRADGETACLTQDKSKQVLMEVAQEYTEEMTSYTQYSAIYNLSDKSMKLWVYPDYAKAYEFSLE